ncbi:MAG: hypothetical protein LBR66_09270 [Candidatus Symbiothrix sp.]|nr:hypothetical protein [Candidatus Symbiothrix sp.]
MSDYTREWFDWLELDEKWLPKLTESLKNIEIDGLLRQMSWEEQIPSLAPSWLEKGTKLKELKISGNQSIKSNEALSWTEKGTKSPNKKLYYLIVTLLLSGIPQSIDELMAVFDYRDKGKFRQNYLKPLESVGFITKTNPDKPTASNQKYVITEKGKRFLTGQEF